MADVGKNIRILRTQRKMTQDELAEKLFVSRQTVSNYETGRSQPDIDTLLRIAEALEVEAQHLLYGSPDTEAQLRTKKSAIAASFALTALAVVYHLLKELQQAYRPRFLFTGLGYGLNLILRPLLFLLAGWTLMQILCAVTNLNPLRHRRAKWVFCGITAALAVYFILVTPISVMALWSDLEVWQLYLSGDSFNYTKSISITPWWDAAAAWLSRHFREMAPLFPALGVALWLTGGKQDTTPSSKIPATRK